MTVTGGYTSPVPNLEGFLKRIDAWQRRSSPVGFVVGVAKKFGDDRGGALAAELTYYGVLSIFPLLLILTTILGFVGNETVSESVIGSALAQFPIFGRQIGKNVAHPLEGSGIGLAVGLVILLYGALGAAQAAQHAMAQVWNVPEVERAGYLTRLARGLLLFVTLGIGMGVTAVLGALLTADGRTWPVRVGGLLAITALDVALYLGAFRILTVKSTGIRSLVPGAVVGGVGYSILLSVGTALVQHQLRHAQAIYGEFGFILGLLAWLFLVARLSLYAAEINVVLTRRLWPRGFTPPLTAADENVLKALGHQEERTPSERIGVGFDPDRVGGAATDAARTS